MNTVLTAWIACTLFALSDTEEAPQDENIVVVYDLNAVAVRFDQTAQWQHTLLIEPGDPYGRMQHVNREEFFDEQGADAVADVLANVLGDELRYEGRQMQVDDRKLIVVAPELVHARVRATLGVLEKALGGGLELAVDILTLDQVDEASWPKRFSMHAGEAEALIGAAEALGARRESHVVRLGAGRTSMLDAMKYVPFVFDYDVEIAQSAMIHDPIVKRAEIGSRLLLRGAPVGDGVALAVLAQSSRMNGPMREDRYELKGALANEKSGVTYVSGPTLFQAPEVHFRSMAFNTFLPTGGAIVFASQIELGGAATTQLWVVRHRGGSLASVHSQRIADSSREVILVNTETFRPPTFSHAMASNYEDTTGYPSLWARMDSEPSIFLFDWMKYRFSVWRRLGPWSIVVTDPSWDREAPEELTKLLQQWKPSADVVRLRATMNAGDGRARMPVRFGAPVRPGTKTAILIGTTSTAVFDYDVEVAQFASVGDPFVAPIFEGLALGIRTTVGQGGASLDVQGEAQLDSSEHRRLAMDSPVLGGITLTDKTRLRINERVPGTPDNEPTNARFGASGSGPSVEIDVR